MSRRAVITGAGAITPHGTLDETLHAVREGRSAVAPLRAFDGAVFGQPNGGEISVDMQPYFRIGKALKLTDRRTRYAVAAAVMAARDAALVCDDATGVLVGSSGSDLQAEDLGRAVAGGDPEAIDYFGGRVLRKLNPLWLLINLPNMASAHVAIQLEARGPNSTITTDWIAGLQAVAEAARWIEDGEADVVIAGGADCGVLPFVFAAYEQAGILADLVPADGAAMFVIEEESRARSRGARILARIAENVGRALQPAPDYTPLLGHALAAAAPIAMALRLREGPGFVVTARGSMGQSASLALAPA